MSHSWPATSISNKLIAPCLLNMCSTSSVDLDLEKWLVFLKNSRKTKGVLQLLPPATKLRQGYVFTRVCDSVHGGGGLCPGQRLPGRKPSLDRDPPWTETPQDRDPLWTETPFGQRPPLDRDPLWTETPLNRDTPGQRPPDRNPPGQRPSLGRDPPPNRDPPGQRSPFPRQRPPIGQRLPTGQRPPSPYGYERAVRILLECFLVLKL